MNGIHDLGGIDGMGPVGPTGWEPPYHAAWEKAAWALFPFAARAGMFGLDEFRRHLEKMHPLHYLTAFYYEHWVEAVERIGTEKAYWTRGELDKRTAYYLHYPDVRLPPNDDPALVDFADWAVKNGFPTARDVGHEPKFAIGDRVVIDASVPRHHHRRPRYTMGRTGEIVMYHGAHVFPDTTGNGQGETAEHLYTVRFTQAELFGSAYADPNACQHTDMWEPYITRAQS
jgi:nitrile hydratase